MNKNKIKAIVALIKQNWRIYDAEPSIEIYQELKCPYIITDAKNTLKMRKKPTWFVREDVFMCVGCERTCTRVRPHGFPLPLPIKYPPSDKEPYTLTPKEMLAKKSLFNVHEVAYILNISYSLVYKYINYGKLVCLKEKPIRIRVDEVKEMFTDFDE